jgi:hypothetical protein
MGGGIFEAAENSDFQYVLPGAQLTINASLVTGNSSGAGGGIYAVATSPVTIKLTAVVRNTPDNCEPLGSISGCFH